MKSLVYILMIFSFLMIGCSKKDTKMDTHSTEAAVHAPYDTTAIDSFSSGAISVDVARQIRMSSQQYQDSLRQVLKQQEEEKKMKEEIEKERKKKDESTKTQESEKKNINNSSSEPKKN